MASGSRESAARMPKASYRLIKNFQGESHRNVFARESLMENASQFCAKSIFLYLLPFPRRRPPPTPQPHRLRHPHIHT